MKSMILSILGLLSPRDLRHLTEATQQQASVLKKVAGAELMFWEESNSPASRPNAQVLPFPAGELRQEVAAAPEKDQADSLDFMLIQRDKFRDSEERIFKQNGLASYRKNADLRLFRVTAINEEGRETTKITRSQGVLINKKQA